MDRIGSLNWLRHRPPQSEARAVEAAAINALAASIFAAIPLLHRFGPLAAVAFTIVLYADLFVLVFLFGTGTGM